MSVNCELRAPTSQYTLMRKVIVSDSSANARLSKDVGTNPAPHASNLTVF